VRLGIVRLAAVAATCLLVLGAVPRLRAQQDEAAALPEPLQRPIDFRVDVYPLLAARCLHCHEGDEPDSGYRLDHRAALLEGQQGRGPFVVPGRSGESPLIRLVAGGIDGKRMPAEGPPLQPREIALLRAWIDQGAAWDERLLPAPRPPEEHWAFQAVRRPPVPEVDDRHWPLNPIDAFIAAEHRRLGLRPAPEASRRVLIRRLYLDLLGLLPPPEEVESFVADPAADAYERLVDRLLAHPAYGERWGRHWLDVARWAETEGYESNHPRPFAWKYRDWVVGAFNRDVPWAQFVRQQIAGDELVPYADENLIATGFLAAARLSSNEEDKLLQRNDVLVDIVNATGAALLGLTVQCAQCHDHKFDPLTQRDYYSLQAFFVRGQPGNLVLRDPQLWAQRDAAKPLEYDALVQLRDALFEKGRQRRVADALQRLDPEQRRALDTPPQQRTPQQETLARQAELRLQFTPAGIEAGLAADDRKLYDEVKKRIEQIEQQLPPKPQTWGYYSPATSPHQVDVLPMVGFYPLPYAPDALRQAEACVLVRGDVHRRGEPVPPAFPTVLTRAATPRRTSSGSASGPPPVPTAAEPQGFSRLALADWLAAPDHPLVPRVWVNRLWHYHFGRGLVATPGDFGLRGARPTHPELLDWLAAEFLASGGRTKHVQRLIVTSRTYRLASQHDPRQAAIDPENAYLWRWLPRRLEAEIVRDVLLSAAGQLDPALGGPSVPLEQESTSSRRGLYLFQKRDNAPQLQALFDGPTSAAESCPMRQTSTTALQPLLLLNSDFALRCAQGLARRTRQAAADGDRRAQIHVAFVVALGREPEPPELQASLDFFAGRQRSPQADVGSAADPLVQFCQTLLNTNEMLYIE
jgi:hypothetical protein